MTTGIFDLQAHEVRPHDRLDEGSYVTHVEVAIHADWVAITKVSPGDAFLRSQQLRTDPDHLGEPAYPPDRCEFETSVLLCRLDYIVRVFRQYEWGAVS